jgi:hypothetical protein
MPAGRTGVRAILFDAPMSIRGRRIGQVSSSFLRSLEEEAPVRVSSSTEPLLSGRRRCRSAALASAYSGFSGKCRTQQPCASWGCSWRVEIRQC